MEAAGKKYKGVRRRRWGKYVSEIRVPCSRERLWLGSYSTPEAAAVAHDTAVYLLRGPSSSRSLSFPQCVPPVGWCGGALSPRSVQRVASDSGMAVDARLVAWRPGVEQRPQQVRWPEEVVLEGEDEWEAFGRSEQRQEGEPLPLPLDISVDDMEICL